MEPSEFKVSQALKATGESEALTEREKHLIGLAVVVTRGCQFCSGRRIEDALKSGIPYETVQATIDLSAAVNAGVVLRTAISGANGVDLDAACKDGACTIESS